MCDSCHCYVSRPPVGGGQGLGSQGSGGAAPCCWSGWGLSEPFLPLPSVSALPSAAWGRRWPRAQTISGPHLCLPFTRPPSFKSADGWDTGPAHRVRARRPASGPPAEGQASRDTRRANGARSRTPGKCRNPRRTSGETHRPPTKKTRTASSVEQSRKEGRVPVDRTPGKCKHFVSSSEDLRTQLHPAD